MNPLIVLAIVLVTGFASITGTLVIAPELIQPDLPEQFGVSTPEGTLYNPRDVSVNSTGFYYIADTLNGRISVFDSSSVFQTVIGFADNNPDDGSLNQPYGVFIDETADLLYVANTFGNNVKTFGASNYTYIDTIGFPGTVDGGLYYPSGVFVNSTNVIISDTFNNRISIFNNNPPTYSFNSTFGTP